MALSTLINGTMGFLKKYPDLVRSANAQSMTQYTKSTRSEPITMIDSKLANLDELPDLMMTLTSIFAAMYAQAFSIAINHTVGDIQVMSTLDKINPNRSKMEGMLALGSILSVEQLSLPDYSKGVVSQESIIDFKKIKISGDNNGAYGFAANGSNPHVTPRLDKDGNPMIDPVTKKPIYEKATSTGQSARADVEAIANFMSNMSTGLLFDVTVEADHRKVSIPISVRLLANRMPSSMIVSIFDAAVRNQTAKERYREWRSGGISFWNDVILCKDILRANRANLIKDNSGVFSEVLRRKSSNQITGAMSGNPSISQISNIIIVSDDTVEEFERLSNKKLKNSQVRNLIFNNTQTLILAVVNRTRETVTLHYHDISVPTVVTFKELKSKGGKGGAPDVMEILKAFQMGNGINL